MKCPDCDINMLNIQDTLYLCEECDLRIPIYDDTIESDPESMSVTDQAQSFFSSMYNHMATGFQSVDKAIKKQRLSICKECEHFSEKNSKCNLCGCFLKIKTSWASEECPIGLWKAVTEKKRRKGCGGCRSNKKS